MDTRNMLNQAFAVLDGLVASCAQSRSRRRAEVDIIGRGDGRLSHADAR
jgi:hypothetical protein